MKENMYNGSTRRTPDEDDRRRRESHTSYSPHSHPYSPQLNGSSHQSPMSTHGVNASFTRYDPLFEHRDSKGGQRSSHSHAYSPTHDLAYEHLEGKSSRKSSHSYTQSPTQSREPLPPYNSFHTNSKSPPTSFQSPTDAHFPQRSPRLPTSHAHPISRQGSIQYSPGKHDLDNSIHAQGGQGNRGHMRTNGYGDPPSSQDTIDDEPPANQTGAREEKTPVKRSDPMSFSNILSSGPPDPPKSTGRAVPASKVFKKASSALDGEHKAPPVPRKSQSKTSLSSKATPASAKTSHKGDTELASHKGASLANGKSAGISKRKSSMLLEKENEQVKAEMAKIDAMDMSDLESPDYLAAKELFAQSRKKRQLDVEAVELPKRKRRWMANARQFSLHLSVPAESGKQRFRTLYEQEALREVQEKEIQDEKERKKDMQRKRRREKTLQQQTQVQKDALAAAEMAEDETEKEKHLREFQKAAKKVITTQRILERADDPDGIREVTPLPHNLEGGTMTTFQSATIASPEPPRKKAKGAPATRPKKSKEKKRAEKESAEAGYAALQRDELVTIAPKDEGSRDTWPREHKETRSHRGTAKESSPAPGVALTNYSTKGYNQIYEQIWKDIARKDAPKVCRIKDQSLATKQSNLRKTAQLAAKEARRWQLRTNKGNKDVQARAKRSMREMMTFWKRNERTERDLRKIAEKQEQENQKKEEAEKEAKRQKNKLNFLISQTELYSHFIGSKLKTDEIERSTDSKEIGASDTTIQAGKPEAHVVKLPPSVADVGAKVTNFDQLDFDAEDDTALRQAAVANAQNAVQDAQQRARAFDTDADGDDKMAQFDDGDMNFQNPTGLGDIDIAQPKMLTVPLKEYQLKGLNWLAGLYDKGINGILADEMGLGKTVQSISVMAHLAEAYGIWGPFLVVAPSSTLHNWNQEVARFVPDLKVVPYWGTAKDRKVLRKIWDRKHIRYTKDSPFHVLITSYQLVVQDSQYFQKMKWQYMILDEAQAIKSSSSSRWKSLLGFNCRNRLLLTGTPIQNNMQELWALLHFIMPTLFDNHDEFSDWFSKDIENHAQSNSKLNEDQLMRLHTILKPFMLRRVKKHVQKELGDKIEEDVYCDLTYRQRAYYTNLRNKISIMDILEKAAVGDEQDSATLMNLVMQFRKVCNHPDLFERAEITSPLSLVQYAETASFLREGNFVSVNYSTRNATEYDLPRLVCSPAGVLDMAGPENPQAGLRSKYLSEMLNIWTPTNVQESMAQDDAFSWLRFVDASVGEVYEASHYGPAERAIGLRNRNSRLERLQVIYDEAEDENYTPAHAMFNIVDRNRRQPLAEVTSEGRLQSLFNVSRNVFEQTTLGTVESCARPGASAPPIEITCSNQGTRTEKENTIFNVPLRKALYSLSERDELALLKALFPPTAFPVHDMLPAPLSEKARYTNIRVPSMRRFVTDSGKLAKLDQLLRQLKEGGHRVLLYFQMTRMIDLMEEYLTYRSYKYLRLDGSTKLEDRRDTVADFQSKPDIFVFLLSTRAGGLGINLTAADTVIFYDSDWNPTIDSQAMDRAHRLGQTKQVTVYRMITRSTIEERIRKRALQKEEVQRVVIQGGGGAGVDFNTRSKDNRTKDMALWLADDEQAEKIEQLEKEAAAKGEEMKGKKGRKAGGKKRDLNIDDMYHEGEGHFDDGSNKPSGAATPIEPSEAAVPGKRKGTSKKAKTAKQRLAIADGSGA